jgi:hypothetical protein
MVKWEWESEYKGIETEVGKQVFNAIVNTVLSTVSPPSAKFAILLSELYQIWPFYFLAQSGVHGSGRSQRGRELHESAWRGRARRKSARRGRAYLCTLWAHMLMVHIARLKEGINR